MMRTRSLHWLLTVAVLLAAGLAAAPARAQIESREGIALRDQIDELRHEVQMLQQQVSSGQGGSMLGAAAPPPPPSGSAGNDVTAQLLVRVDQLESQVRQLHGRIDELQNQLQRQTADLGKRIDDLTFLVENPKAATEAAAAARRAAAAAAAHPAAPPGGAPAPTPLGGAPSPSLPTGVLGTLPAGPPNAAQPYAGPPNAGAPGYAPMAATPLGAGSPQAGPPGAGPAVPRTPELAMQEGTAALARRDYTTAEAAAREILNGKRTSPRAYDAMFLLAQVQYDQRQYSQAALSFDDTYNRARKGPHASDSLVGLANSLIGLGDRTSACQALTKLHLEFPTLREGMREQVAQARQRAGCR